MLTWLQCGSSWLGFTTLPGVCVAQIDRGDDGYHWTTGTQWDYQPSLNAAQSVVEDALSVAVG